MRELWLDRRNGVFQLKRIPPPRPPPAWPPACPPAWPPPPAPPRPPGRVEARSPVRRLTRLMAPFWLSVYTRSGSFGSTRQTKPSPPPTEIQSSLIGPVPLRLTLGPPQEPLSCRPP